MDGENATTGQRDPGTMSRDELVAYVDGGGDISELLFGALRRSALTHQAALDGTRGSASAADSLSRPG